TEYWQSLPKKYCQYCKCWFADNKASVEFHEKGLRHQGNVRKRLSELRKKGSQQLVEQKLYNTELMKIEAAAMKSFQKDISSNPRLAAELASTTSVVNKLPEIRYGSNSSEVACGRYGDSHVEEESTTLVRGREKALDTIAKSLERKAKWLEAKTAEGNIYYWNRDTYETRNKPPKSGFLSLDEQLRMNITNAPGDMSVPSTSKTFKIEPYGKWQVVNDKPYNENMVDLQLPNSTLPQLAEQPVVTLTDERKKIEFKEKVVETLDPKRKAGECSFTFKKRKTDTKRCLRQRDEGE
ncbi:hypothetical protein B4U80_00601, partial [Leptotrombidium deliense]